MSLLSRFLRSFPEIRRLQEECDGLRSDRNSMRLKVQAISGQMGVQEEEIRVLRAERDRRTAEAARQAAEIERQSALLAEAAAARDAARQEHDDLRAERDALVSARDEAARNPGPGPQPSNGPANPGDAPKPQPEPGVTMHP